METDIKPARFKHASVKPKALRDDDPFYRRITQAIEDGLDLWRVLCGWECRGRIGYLLREANSRVKWWGANDIERVLYAVYKIDLPYEYTPIGKPSLRRGFKAPIRCPECGRLTGVDIAKLPSLD